MDFKKIVLGILGFLIRAAIALAVIYYVYEFAFQAYNFGYEVFVDPPYALAPGRDINVTVSDPTDYKKMAKDFEEAGLIGDWKLFFVQVYFSEYKDDLQPGSYVLNNSMNSQDLLLAMTPDNGKNVEGEDGEEGEVVDMAEDMTEVVTEEEMMDGTVDNGETTEGGIVDNAGDIAPEEMDGE